MPLGNPTGEPPTTTGAILRILHRYVPVHGDKFIKIPTNGEYLFVCM